MLYSYDFYIHSLCMTVAAIMLSKANVSMTRVVRCKLARILEGYGERIGMHHTKKINRWACSSPMALGLIAVCGTAHAVPVPATIDDYADPIFVLTDTNPPGAASSISQTGIDLDPADAGVNAFGDERTVTLRTNNPGLSASAIVIRGLLDLNVGPGTTADLALLYDDFTSLDITGEGNFNAFAVIVTFIQGNSEVAVTVSDSDSTDTATTVVSGTGPTLASVIIPFADFTGIDFTDVDSITLNFNVSDEATDVRIDRFALTQFVIPEPASAMLLVAGASLMISGRRRR